MKEWHERIKALKPIMAKQSGKLVDRLNTAQNKSRGSWAKEMELTFISGGLTERTSDAVKQQAILGSGIQSLHPNTKYEVQVTQQSSAGMLGGGGGGIGATIWARPMVVNPVKWEGLAPGAITLETINVAAKPPNQIVTYEIDGEVIDFEVIFDDVTVKEVPKPTSDTDLSYKKYVDDLVAQKQAQADYDNVYNAYQSVWTNNSSALELVNQAMTYTTLSAC